VLEWGGGMTDEGKKGWRLGQMPKGGPAVGTDVPGGKKALVVKIDVDQFDEIRNRAISENTSMAEQIRNLLQWGMDSLDEVTK